MLRNYLTIAWRNLLRHQVFSLINIMGLALGLACSMLIWLWVADERSYDQFHVHIDQLHMVFSDVHYSNGETSLSSNTPGLVAPLLKTEVPEVQEVLRLSTADDWEDYPFLRVGEKVFKQKACYADASLFSMFSFSLKAGDPKTLFRQLHSIALSQRVAGKLFGSANPLGKIVSVQYLEGKQDYAVTGVFEDVPRQSSLQFDFVVPYEEFQLRNDWLNQWGSKSIKTFVQLRPKASPSEVNLKIKGFARKHYKEANYDLLLQPYQELYLHADYQQDGKLTERITYVRLFTVIALFILAIACINFMNLSTARATTRAREVGIRKVVGASRMALIRQFMGESLLVTVLGMLLALSLVQLLLPSFSHFTGKNLAIPFGQADFRLGVVAVTLFTGLLAGSYPAMFLSSFQPVKVLKGLFRMDNREISLRKGLVVFQFVLATVLPIASLAVYAQIQYLKNKNLGLNRANVIYFPLNTEMKSHAALRQTLSSYSAIRSLSFSSANPLTMLNISSDPRWDGKNPADNTDFINATTDYDFIRTLGITLKEGRDFSRDFSADSSNYLINEEAARRMNMRNPVGQNLHFWRGKGKIIGVMKDFHHRSMHAPIEPLILMLWPSDTYVGLIRANAGQTDQALEALRATFRKHCPSIPLEYHFLDETFAQLYKSETLTGQLAFYFTGLSIFISCLGLFGLASFATAQRTKEIGVRKVLGAPVSSILLLLSKDFIRLVLLANVVAWPLAYWGVRKWLENYAFRIDIQPWLFVIPALLVLLIALLTVSVQTIKAARQNPVKALRYE